MAHQTHEQQVAKDRKDPTRIFGADCYFWNRKNGGNERFLFKCKLNSLLTLGKIKLEQCVRESCDPYERILPVMEGRTAAFGAWLNFAPFPALPTAVVMDKWEFISNSSPVCVLCAHQQSVLTAIPSRLSALKGRGLGGRWLWGKVSAGVPGAAGSLGTAESPRCEGREKLGFCREKSMQQSIGSRKRREL